MHFRILKMIATIGFLTAPECTEFVFGPSSARTLLGSLQHSPAPPIWYKGSLLLRGKRGEGKAGDANSWICPWTSYLLAIETSQVWLLLRHCWATTLGKLFTPLCICHHSPRSISWYRYKQEALLLQRNRATRYVSWNIMAVFLTELLTRSSANPEEPCEYTVSWNRVNCCTNVRRIACEHVCNRWMTFKVIQGHCRCHHLIGHILFHISLPL